jgi:hypothetical protein
MPYKIRYKKGVRPWKIVDENGVIKGSSLTEKDAKASIRARLAGEHGWKGRK